jgi:hypothetical protein
MARTDNENGATKAASLRRSQQKERGQLASEISKSQTNLAALQEQRAPIASEVRKVEAEVGPIKYIAAVIYEGTPTDDILEKAVRFVTMMIVAVFDPLAVLLLIAANWNLKQKMAKVPEPEDDYQLPDPYVADVGEPPTTEEKVVWEGIDHTRLSSDSDEEEDELPEPAKSIAEAAKEAEEHIALTNTEVEEDLEVTIDDAPKDWEPELYARKQVKNDEVGAKAQSFLSKVQGGAGVSTNTIELEVEGLQHPKS